MEHETDTTRPGTPPEPARDVLAERADRYAETWEAKLAEVEAKVEAMPPASLAELVRQAAGQISEHARECREEESEWAYRAEAAAVYRAAEIIERTEAALASVSAQEEWDAGTLSDFVEELRAILEGGAR